MRVCVLVLRWVGEGWVHGGRVLSIFGSCFCSRRSSSGCLPGGGSWGEESGLFFSESAALVTWTLGNSRRKKTFDLHWWAVSLPPAGSPKVDYSSIKRLLQVTRDLEFPTSTTAIRMWNQIYRQKAPNRLDCTYKLLLCWNRNVEKSSVYQIQLVWPVVDSSQWNCTLVFWNIGPRGHGWWSQLR